MRIPSLLEQRIRDQIIIISEALPAPSFQFKFTGEETWLIVFQTGAKKDKIDSTIYNHLTKMLPVIVTWDRDTKGDVRVKILEKPRSKEKFITHFIERGDF